MAQIVKNLPAMQETQVQSLCWEDSLEKEMASIEVMTNELEDSQYIVFTFNQKDEINYFKFNFLFVCFSYDSVLGIRHAILTKTMIKLDRIYEHFFQAFGNSWCIILLFKLRETHELHPLYTIPLSFWRQFLDSDIEKWSPKRE